MQVCKNADEGEEGGNMRHQIHVQKISLEIKTNLLPFILTKVNHHPDESLPQHPNAPQ